MRTSLPADSALVKLRPFLLAGAMLVLLLWLPAGDLSVLPLDRSFQSPGWRHPLGTDDLGRDMLLAIAQGARSSLFVAILATTLSVLLGLAIGLSAGLGPWWVDELLMRCADVFMSLPLLLVAVLVAALFGGSLLHLAVLLGCMRWTTVARIVRAEALVTRDQDFVLAARAVGTSPLAIAWRHVLPQVMVPALPAASIIFSGAVLAEAACGFVGLGDPTATSLGLLVANGFAFFSRAWWVWVFPAGVLVIFAMMVGVYVQSKGAIAAAWR